MKKNVWILNHHANSMYFDGGGRHFYFAKYLKQKGYKPVIFCSNAEHGSGKICFEFTGNYETHFSEEISVPFVFVKGRPYIGNGKDRILCMYDYYRNVIETCREYGEKNGRPDIIIGSSVHPLAIMAAEKLAKYYRVECIAEVRDLWPESFVAYNVIKPYNPLVHVMRLFERYLYDHATKLIFTAEGAYDYIEERKWTKSISKSKVFYINNGVDLETFNDNKSKYKIDDKDLIDTNVLKIVFAGSLSKGNQVSKLVRGFIDAKLINAKLLIWGDGEEYIEIQNYLSKNNISNVVLKGKVSKCYIPYICSCADINIMHSSEQGLYRYGVSPNKLFDYLAAGRPIIMDFVCGYNFVISGNAGIQVDGTGEQFKDALVFFSQLSKAEYNVFCQNAIKIVNEYDYLALTERLVQVIEGETNGI